MPRRNVYGWVLLIVGLCAIGAMLLVPVGTTLPTASDSPLVEVRMSSPTARGSYKIAVVDLEGVILQGGSMPFLGGGELYGLFHDTLDKVDSDPKVRGLLLVLNSPGGGLTASDQLYHHLKMHKQRWAAENRPVTVMVLMGDLAASGGYYLSVGADHIMAHPTTLTGSIGVIMSGWNYSGLMDKLGISDATVTSVEHKDLHSPYRPPAPFESERMRQVLRQMHEQFTAAVLEGRQRVVKSRQLTQADVDAWATGNIYTAKEALALNMIDSIGYESDALNVLRSLVNPNATDEPLVVRYQRKPASLFGLPGVTVNKPAVSDWATVAQELLTARRLPNGVELPRVWALWPGR